MEQLLQTFIGSFDKGVWTGFVALAVYLLLKNEPFKLVAYYNDRRDKKHDFVRSLLDSGKLSDEANYIICDQLENAVFRRCFGINADAHMRSALIALHNQHQATITWVHIRRAYPHLKLIEGRIGVELRWHDKLFRCAVIFIALICGAYSMLAIAVAILVAKQLTSNQFFAITSYSLLLLAGAMYFSSLNWPYSAARKIDGAVRASAR